VPGADGASRAEDAHLIRTRVRGSLDAFKQVFKHRDLRYLELALGLNWSAENGYLIALSVYAYDYGGATAVGLVGMIRMLPAGVVGLFGGVFADRYRREWLLRLLYLGRALLAGATALAVMSGAPIAVVFALAAVMNVMAVLLRPAAWALLPNLSRTPEALVACNVVASIFEGLAWLVGPAVAALLISVADESLAFLATALVLAASTIYSARVKAKHLVQEAPPERRVIAETSEAVRLVTRNRDTRILFGLFGAQTMVRGALNVLIVVAAIELLGLGEPGVGWLSSAYGVGGLIGALAALALVGRRRLAVPIGVGLILWGAPIALVGIWPNPVAALLLLAVPGIGNAVLDVSALTLLQRLIPNRILGRVFGALEAQVFATVGIGSLIAPLLVAWIGARGALIATGALLPSLAALAWRRLQKIDDETVVPETELELLRGVPMFATLSAVALEQLAGSLAHVSVPARERVFSRGEHGDRFYLIVKGEVRVSVGRTTTARLGPGDCFGEIALLRGIPRTATVTAEGDLQLYALESEPFLAAISGNMCCVDEASRFVVERLEQLPKPPSRPAKLKAARARVPASRTAGRRPARPPVRSSSAPAAPSRGARPTSGARRPPRSGP
jgi:MFS family permease